MRLNGAAVDGIVGTRSRSQYDLRTLYSTFDVLHLLREAVRETLKPKSNCSPIATKQNARLICLHKLRKIPRCVRGH